jgi:hypothetical protein
MSEKKKYPQWIRRFLFGAACLATVVALFYAEENLRGKRAWENYMRESSGKGIELDWHAYVPPSVPDDQNFAATPLFEDLLDYEYTKTNVYRRDTNIWARMQRVSFQGSRSSDKLGEWVYGRPLDLEQWQDYFRNGKLHATTNDWPASAQPQEPAADVLLALSKLEADLAELREAAARPQSRFPVHYDELAKAMLPHLAYLRSFSQVLQLRAVAELSMRNNQQAYADTMLAFRCADAIESEPFMISQIVRCRIVEGDLQPIWEGLSAHRWSENQLEELQRYFLKQDLLARFSQSLKADVAFTCGWIDSLSDDPSSLDVIDDASFPNSPVEALLDGHILPRGWIYQNELSAARFCGESLSSDVVAQSQRVYPELSASNAALFEHLPTNAYNFAFKHVGGVVSPQGFARAQTDINLALVACALERFRMAHGHFPENLAALAPEFLETVPHDIINGEPLHYRLTKGGNFTVYSVGWNGKDDGGMFPPPSATMSKGFRSLFTYHPEEGDWVWRYPEAKRP